MKDFDPDDKNEKKFLFEVVGTKFLGIWPEDQLYNVDLVVEKLLGREMQLSKKMNSIPSTKQVVHKNP